MTKKTVETEIIGAGLLMEQLFKDGIYQSYKMCDNASEAMKDEMKNRIPQELKTKEFKEQGVIARYYSHPTYETDITGLNELLYDLGIICEVAKFEDVGELEDFKKPIQRYIKFNIGKLGKVEKAEYNFDGLTDEELAVLWLREKTEMDRLEGIIDVAKHQMEFDPIIRSLPEGKRKLSCSYGSVSLLDNKRTHYNDRILREFGSHYVIQHSRPIMEEVEKFKVKGYISQSQIDQFRTMIKLDIRFVMLPAQSYQRQGELIHGKRMKQAQNLQELWSHKRNFEGA